MNNFGINARQKERKFMRMMAKQGYFRTVNGNINRIVTYNGDRLTVQTDSKGGLFQISRKKLRNAISFIFFKRTAVRNDLAPYSNFTSALFGICRIIFEDISKIQTLKNGMYRLNLLATRFFASGLERDPAVLKIVNELGGRFVLFNYYQLRDTTKWLEYLETYDLYAVIDSGAYSIHRQKSKQQNKSQTELFTDEQSEEMTLEGYAAFINKHKSNSRILGFFPLDVIGDANSTRENHIKLKGLTDATIYPVWQFTDSLESLNELVDEEPEMIGIGGTVPFLSNRKEKVRAKLNQVFSQFPNANFHFLGGANEMLTEYRWFSSDSTAFLNARKSYDQRDIYLSNGHRVAAPSEMSTIQIIKQNLTFLFSLENYTDCQLALPVD